MAPPAGVILFVNNNLGKTMSELINNIRVEEGTRKRIPVTMFELLISGKEVIVSGMPLLAVPSKVELPIEHFDRCQYVHEEPVMVRRIFNQRLPIVGHRHIPEVFIEENGYPVVQCFTFTGDELLMGIRKSLGFDVKGLDVGMNFLMEGDDICIPQPQNT